jgi:hypothetical protein
VTGLPAELVKTLTFRPGQRDDRPRRAQPGDHSGRALRPPALALGTGGHQQEHQRAAARVRTLVAPRSPTTRSTSTLDKVLPLLKHFIRNESIKSHAAAVRQLDVL